jgi:hypothetical protein
VTPASGDARNPSSQSSIGSGEKGGAPVKRKILVKSRDDILITPRKWDEEKLTAKEMERTKKWRNMAVIQRPNGTIHYSFPMSRKVQSPLVLGSLIVVVGAEDIQGDSGLLEGYRVA